MTRPDPQLLDELRRRYRAAPGIYHATRYWENYQAGISQEIERLDLERIDSGLYPYLATFGFGTAPYRRRSKSMRGGSAAAWSSRRPSKTTAATCQAMSCGVSSLRRVR